MQRQQRITAARALQLILEGADEEQEENYSSESESDGETNGGHAQVAEEDALPRGRERDEEEEYGDIYISDETDDTDEEDDNDNETATGILRGRGLQFRDQPFQKRRRTRNVVNFESRNMSHPQSDFEAFLLCIPEEVIRTIQMYICTQIAK